MPSKLFNIPSRQLKHHTISLTPDVEALVNAATSYFMEEVTNETGHNVNFSTCINLFILVRVAQEIIDQRKGRKPDPDVMEYVMDLIDHKRQLTKQDFEDYKTYSKNLREAYIRRNKS